MDSRGTWFTESPFWRSDYFVALKKALACYKEYASIFCVARQCRSIFCLFFQVLSRFLLLQAAQGNIGM